MGPSRGAGVRLSFVVVIFWVPFFPEPFIEVLLGKDVPRSRMLMVLASHEHVSECDGTLVNWELLR